MKRLNAYKKPKLIFKNRRLLSYTTVGIYNVPVVNAEYATIATFRKGDLGKFERGDFLFWTAVFKKEFSWRGYQGTDRVRKMKLILGRARAVLSPGDRFDRMRLEMRTDPNKEDRRIYKEWWFRVFKEGDNIKFIRPSTKREVYRWMEGHKSDAKDLVRLVIGGKLPS